MQLTTVQLKKKINNIKTFNTAIKEELGSSLKNDSQFLDRIFCQLSTEIGSKDVQSVTNYLNDIAIAISQAERGLLYIKDKKNYRLISARDGEHKNIIISSTDFSRNILHKAIELRQLVQIIDKELLSGHTNVNNIKLKFIMCAPLIINGDNIGAIYVDSSKPLRKAFRFSPEFFSLFANRAAIFIRNIQTIA